MRQFGDADIAREKRSALGRSCFRFAAALLCVAVCSSPNSARADEGGVSFWVLGFFGSLAATPQQPGFSYAQILYHASVSAGGNVAFARQGDRVGCFESRVAGIGPQIGYIIPLSSDYQGYINLKGYKEFAAENRPDGWNVWLTFAISPAAKQEAAAKKGYDHEVNGAGA